MLKETQKKKSVVWGEVKIQRVIAVKRSRRVEKTLILKIMPIERERENAHFLFRKNVSV